MAAPVDYVMRVSSNGQVSIPAAARARWQAAQVVVVDLGDRLVIRPANVDGTTSLRGKYKGRGPDTETARAADRDAEGTADHRRRGNP